MPRASCPEITTLVTMIHSFMDRSVLHAHEMVVKAQ
jgi:hypothetical protein